MARPTILAVLCGLICLGAVGDGWRAASAEPPQLVRQPIFKPEKKHNHSSCVVETANGDLLAVWYSGTGERKSDDVLIQAAWLAKGAKEWSPRFVTADTPGYPDCNPAVFADPDGKIWLFWPTILDHRWEGALLKYAVADAPQTASSPIAWSRSGVLHLTPESAPFAEAIHKAVASLTPAEKEKYKAELEPVERRADDLLYQRLGWMPRVHAVVLPSGRWILPLYCDTFSSSIMAISDDKGQTWKAGDLMVGFGNIQPSLVRKNDGTLAAYMRDNGPHHKIRLSTSPDEGKSWTPVVDTALPNPGAGIEAIRLASGRWALVYNDLDRGRHSLAVSLSDDEGATWSKTRHVERAETGKGSFHYPSMIQSRDGAIHLTYTHSVGGESTIMHAVLTEDWVLKGD
ncbi:MAG: exo-alpha-sialidase [Paludisphaera borealis]|uniref:sialidase family protein n=1 Tax=Paludisphaera borealis TaxID=1387353 RepID=UPI00284F2A56|nr:exo-alpha-sialidase [Paludisphaera borealis]MDR3623054.1 exo-alpha-sialidase [Paludisphaera borealis]